MEVEHFPRGLGCKDAPLSLSCLNMEPFNGILEMDQAATDPETDTEANVWDLDPVKLNPASEFYSTRPRSRLSGSKSGKVRTWIRFSQVQ